MPPLFLPLIAVLLVPTFEAPASAQTIGGEWPTAMTLQSDALGFARAANRVEDIDGDGVADCAIGLPYLSTIWGTQAGAVKFYSGATGLLLRTTYGANDFGRFGHAITGLHDVNNDGVGDYLISAPRQEVNGMLLAGSIYLCSGADGSQLWKLDGPGANALFGNAIAATADLDGDLIDDILVGAPGSSPNGNAGSGAAFVYSGATGSFLASYSGEASGDAFGHSIASAGDVNNDGFSDVLVGAITTDINFRSNCGSAYVYSGFDGTLLWRANGASNDDFFGRAVAGTGDLNRDGFADIMVGAPGADPNNFAFAGSTFVYSGVDGSLLFRLDGQSPSESFGFAVTNAGDVNGDQTNDLLIGAPDANFQAGYCAIFSGVDGSLLNLRADTSPSSQLGFAVCSLGDLDNDGLAEVLATAPHTEPTTFEDSFVFLYGFDPYLWSDHAELSASAGGSATYRIDFPTDLGNNAYKLLGTNKGSGSTSIGGVLVPLHATGPVWNALAAITPPSVLTNSSGILNGDGNAIAVLTLPAGAANAFIDTDIHFAALTFQMPATGLASSAAIKLRILP